MLLLFSFLIWSCLLLLGSSFKLCSFSIPHHYLVNRFSSSFNTCSHNGFHHRKCKIVSFSSFRSHFNGASCFSPPSTRQNRHRIFLARYSRKPIIIGDFADGNEEMPKVPILPEEKVNRFAQIRAALLEYKAVHGDLLVPAKYIVPANDTRYSDVCRGIKLGYVVSNIRSRDFYKEHKEELLVMGFDYNKQIRNFDEVKAALLAYKQQYGDLLVPARFVIPHNDNDTYCCFPEEMKGMKLGKVVNAIRCYDFYKEHKEELLTMGFDYGSQIRDFEEVKAALLAYKAIYGDLLVPAKFVIPHNNHDNDNENENENNALSFPQELKGMKLGKVVNAIRGCDIYKEHKEELLAMGFDYHKQQGDFGALIESLLVFKSLYDDVNDIPEEFFIGANDTRYPKQLRGKDLGRRVMSIRKLDCYTRFRVELEAIGMRFTFQPVPFAVFKESLEIYKKLHEDCYVYFGYDTRKDTNYPKEMRGSNILYKHVNCIRTGHIYQGEEYRRELEAIGFDYHKKTGDFALLREALLVYKEIYGDLLVPCEFVISSNDIRFPEQMRGRALGSSVQEIRNSKLYKEHRKELLAMGFDYSNQVRKGNNSNNANRRL